MRIAAALALLLAMPGHADAQQSIPSPPDFLFGRPEGSLTLRGSWVFARAGSDLFDFVERELTIDQGNFNRASLAADYGITLAPRAEAVIGIDVNRASVTRSIGNSSTTTASRLNRPPRSQN
jgi:hypothetical protein